MFFSVLPVACWLPVLNIVKPETLIFPIASLHSIQSYEKNCVFSRKKTCLICYCEEWWGDGRHYKWNMFEQYSYIEVYVSWFVAMMLDTL